MGNFYTNVIVRGRTVDAVADVLDALGRRAFVAGDASTTVVYDERCDGQDLAELERLASTASGKLRTATLAVCNHDDDVLWYALGEDGRVVDQYNSFPGYFDGSGKELPEGGDAERLCAAFGAVDQRAAVRTLLRRTHGEVGMEIDRHTELLRLLGLSSNLGTLGYEYVKRGELAEVAPGVEMRAVGGAVVAEPAPRRPGAAPTAVGEETTAVHDAEVRQLPARSAALALVTVDVPSHLADVLGTGQVNGFALLARLQWYVTSHRLVGLVAPLVVHADDRLAELLGEREFVFAAMPHLLMRAFAVPPLSDEDAAKLQTPGSEVARRYEEGMRRAMREIMKDRLPGIA